MKRDIKISVILIFSLCIVIYISNWYNSKADRKYKEFKDIQREYELNSLEDMPDYVIWGLKNKFRASVISSDKKSYYTIQDIDSGSEESEVTYMLTVPEKYAVEVNLEMVSKRELDLTEGKSGDFVIEREMDEFVASVFDLETGELLNTIYIDKIFKMHDLNVMPVDCTGFATCNYKDKPCLAFDVKDIATTLDDVYDNSKKTIYIDLKSGELFEEKYEDLRIQIENKNKDNFVLIKKINSLMAENKRNSDSHSSEERYSVENLGFWEGYRKIHLTDVYNTIENNEKINYIFPDLKENYKKISDEYHKDFSLDIVLSGNPSDDEIIDIIESDILK